ncbi:MAG: hypothetical protein M3Y56_12620 [Armatimonadota bacterium]|nr:hypothetical protein [Armatimonadota bacterium]
MALTYTLSLEGNTMDSTTPFTMQQTHTGRDVSTRPNRRMASLFPILVFILSGAAALAKGPLPVQPTARPSHLTDWVLVAVAVLVIFAILHTLHRKRSRPAGAAKR